MCTEKMHIKIRCIKYSETNNKINTGYPIKKRSVKQLVIKPWDGFCGPLEVRTHPLPPPDSDCVMLDVKLQLFNLQWFRVLGASFSSASFSIGASFSRFRCFVFEFWVLRFRDLGASCFRLRFRVLRFRNYHVVAREARSRVFTTHRNHRSTVVFGSRYELLYCTIIQSLQKFRGV